MIRERVRTIANYWRKCCRYCSPPSTYSYARQEESQQRTWLYCGCKCKATSDNDVLDHFVMQFFVVLDITPTLQKSEGFRVKASRVKL